MSIVAEYRVLIPDFVPTLLNKLMSANRWSRGRSKRSDAEIIAWYLRQAGVPQIGLTCAEKSELRRLGIKIGLTTDARKRAVAMEVMVKGRGRMPDPDAFAKSTLDAMVSGGYLVDDSQRWCEWSTPTIVRGGSRQTVIVLRDIGKLSEKMDHV